MKIPDRPAAVILYTAFEHTRSHFSKKKGKGRPFKSEKSQKTCQYAYMVNIFEEKDGMINTSILSGTDCILLLRFLLVLIRRKMRYFKKEIVLQEVPGEISLCYFICGCPLHCKGCHSYFTWNEQTGYKLDVQDYKETLERYKSYISCILFMGGEWHENELIHLLCIAREKGLKTCLYTGLDDVSIPLRNKLTYLKTGPWIPELGGLNSPSTNQRMIELKTGECLNPCFQREILVG